MAATANRDLKAEPGRKSDRIDDVGYPAAPDYFNEGVSLRRIQDAMDDMMWRPAFHARYL